MIPPQMSGLMKHSVDQAVLEILVCPVTGKELEFNPTDGELVSRAAGLAYPIRDGIPIMLRDQARKLSSSAEK